MPNVSEILDLLISSALFIYLIILIRKRKNYIRTYWFWGIITILISKVITIAEEYMLPDILNITEHIFFAIGCIFLFTGILRREL